jgi:hypothetical protein
VAHEVVALIAQYGLLLVFVNVATRTMAGGLDAWGAARYPVQRLAPAIEPSPGGGARMPA